MGKLEIFKAVSMIDVFLDFVPCGSSQNRRFGGTYHLHLQDNETLASPQLVAMICLRADCEEIIVLITANLPSAESHLLMRNTFPNMYRVFLKQLV
jgi:hypothetical protein